jgi:hypothetical protein
MTLELPKDDTDVLKHVAVIIIYYFFLKFLKKKSWCVLWAGVSYGPRNTVIPWDVTFCCFTVVSNIAKELRVHSSCTA